MTTAVDLGCKATKPTNNQPTAPILKTRVQFENLVFVIMSTRENTRLITRAPNVACQTFYHFFRYKLNKLNITKAPMLDYILHFES